ncbi:MAG: hypothetical protein NW224_21995 [Leptolyngbyaceae cyanobacterium bins.302]|nr:hypothetical protein [Leptolyngbyaceae cyanobacterium bins.302]
MDGRLERSVYLVVIGLTLTSVTMAVSVLSPLPAQAEYGFLEIKDASGEVAWRCEGQFQGNSGQGLCVSISDAERGSAYKYYRGQVRNSTFTGNGTLVYANDDRYQGQFQNGRPQGKGMFFSVQENRRYEGDFRNGLFHGQGVYTFANGNRYVGQFAGGQPHGRGEFTFLSNGQFSHSYVGKFYLGVINGNGTVTNANGTRCTGVFYSNNLAGRGTCTFPSNSPFKSYTGELNTGRPEGRGNLVYRDGKRYSGQFRNGVPGISADTGS